MNSPDTNTSVTWPNREYRTWLIDSRRWDKYESRVGDICVATYPKSGTTWVLRIISLLIFNHSKPISLDYFFPWWENRVGPDIKDLSRRYNEMTHRRCTKSHLPFDGLPIFDNLKYIHVVRDPRDVAMSYHNHTNGFTPDAISELNKIGLADSFIQGPYPNIEKDPAEFFHNWLTKSSLPGQPDGMPFLSFFHFEKTFLDNRFRKNLLFVHYNDLKQNLGLEMKRIARFIDLKLQDYEIDELAKAASFASMKRDAQFLVPSMIKKFDGGAERIFNKGDTERWRNVFRTSDLELLNEKMHSHFNEKLCNWIFHGSASGEDPKQII